LREGIYSDPFIDIDEWRDAPVRHRYVHGGFKNTELLFSFYFPPKDHYQGRFFQPQTYPRHQIPAPEYYAWNQYKGPDGKRLGREGRRPAGQHRLPGRRWAGDRAVNRRRVVVT
jgi:hypothetical protein